MLVAAAVGHLGLIGPTVGSLDTWYSEHSWHVDYQ